jgi:hypothetical protein
LRSNVSHRFKLSEIGVAFFVLHDEKMSAV